MSEYSQDSYRGILVPERRINADTIDTAASSYSQAGPEVGIPVPQDDTDLNLKSSGTQAADGALRVVTQRGGFGGEGRATYRWKNEADASTAWRGWDPPSALSSWRALHWTDGTATGPLFYTATHTPAAITLPDQTVLCAFYAETTVVGKQHQVAVTRIEADGTTSTSIAYFRPTAPVHGLHPCLVRLPSGRVLLFHYLEDQTVGFETMQIAVKYSDDDGATWSKLTDSALAESINIDSSTSGFALNDWPSRGLRAAYSNGQILLLVGVRSHDLAQWRDYLLHFASDDLGSHFDLVEDWGAAAGTNKGCRPRIIPRDVGFDVFYIRDANTVKRKTLGDAFSSILSAPAQPLTYTGGVLPIGTEGTLVFTDAELAVVETDSGEGYLAVRFKWGSHHDRIGMTYSRWGFRELKAGQLMGQSAVGALASAGLWGTLWNGEGNGDYPRDLEMVGQNGRVLMLHNWIATVGNEDDSLGAAYLGGYSTVNLPTYAEDSTQESRLTWEATWWPIEKPNLGLGWTLAGAGTSTLQAGALNLSTTTQAINYTRTPPGTPEEGIVASFGVQFVSDVLGAEDIRAEFEVGDGSISHKIKIAIKQSSVKVTDVNAASTLGVTNIDCTAGVAVLVFMNALDSRASVFVAPMNHSADTTWLAVCDGVTVTDGGVSSSSITWGHDTGTSESNWFWMNFTSDKYAAGARAAAGFTNPDDLEGRSYGSRLPTFVSGGVALQAIDGPTIPGDEWHINTRYAYPVTAALPPVEPSPSHGWRSTDETAQTIVWDLEGPITHPTIGLMLEGVNWRTATLSGWNASTSAWETLANIDTATGQAGVPVATVGDSLVMNTAAEAFAGRYVEDFDLDGGIVEFVGGAIRRTIGATTRGLLNNTAGQQGATLRLSDATGAEPATDLVNIWSPRIVVAMHSRGIVYTKLRLVINASQGTPAGYYTIGAMALGPIHLFTTDYSYGRIQELEANTALATYRDGRRTSTVRGKPRRSVRFAWMEGVDTTTLNGPNPSPDHVVTTSTGGAAAVGYRGDLPAALGGLERETDGAHRPVVYLPSIPKGPPDTMHLQGRSAALYGRRIGPVTADTLVGHEGSATAGEVMKISTVRIEEEL